MGLFGLTLDGLQKVSDEWGGKATEALRNLSPTTQQIGKELDIITGKSDDKLYLEKANDLVQDVIADTPQNVKKAWEEETPKVTETLRNLSPTTQAIGGELDKITGKNDDKLLVQQVQETIENIPDWYVETTKQNFEGAKQGLTDFVGESKERLDTVVNTTTTTIDRTIVQPVKETVTNVTKGISEALPIVAIGAGGLILASLLLGRR